MSITLTSCDGTDFTVERDVALMSETIKELLEEVGTDTLPIPHVKATTLAKVIEWCQYHKENPLPPVSDVDKYRSDNITPWDLKFMEMYMELMMEVIAAANYLNIPDLLELGCKTLANMIKGHSPDEVKEMFSIQ